LWGGCGVEKRSFPTDIYLSFSVLSIRVALAFETLTPKQVCAIFSRALRRPCRYTHVSRIEVKVPIPAGYREQLQKIEILFGQLRAPYFPGPEFTQSTSPGGKGVSRTHKSGPASAISSSLVDEARALWPGWRSMEEYAREVFPVEEEANGLDWMI
jgi:hypothetical protein